MHITHKTLPLSHAANSPQFGIIVLMIVAGHDRSRTHDLQVCWLFDDMAMKSRGAVVSVPLA